MLDSCSLSFSCRFIVVYYMVESCRSCRSFLLKNDTRHKKNDYFLKLLLSMITGQTSILSKQLLGER